MATWFECRFKYNQENEKGGVTSVSECYLVDAVSFTDAEARVYNEIGSNYREFALLKVAKYPLHDLVHNEGSDKWYKCKVAIITLDEKSGKERKQKQTIIASADNIKQAYESVDALFGGSISDYEIMDIVSTNITEILPYVEEERKLTRLEDLVDKKDSEEAEPDQFEPMAAAEIGEETQSEAEAKAENN